jgi:hypothetical protein
MNELSLEERLIKLIKDMSEDQQRKLLSYMESQQAGYRKYPRKDVSIATAYVIKDTIYTDFIKNISAGGVYIITNKSKSVGDEISMNFMLTGHKRPIRVFGKVVRIGPTGFAVKFIEDLEDLIDKLDDK